MKSAKSDTSDAKLENTYFFSKKCKILHISFVITGAMPDMKNLFRNGILGYQFSTLVTLYVGQARNLRVIYFMYCEQYILTLNNLNSLVDVLK